MPTASAQQAKRPRNLAQIVVDSLTAQIRNGTLRPGDKLPAEAEVMEQQGVSRSVVREAISRLQAAGLVETRHGVGTFVLTPSRPTIAIDPATILTVRDVIAILELRISLETECAGLAAARRTNADLAVIRHAFDSFERAASAGQDTVDFDHKFHLAIAHATGNQYFPSILQHLGPAIIPRGRLNLTSLTQVDPVSYMERVTREHAQIVDAIARGDVESARAAMRLHLGNSQERLQRAQERLEGGASVPHVQ